jgi:hypothetical protein
VPLPLSGQWSRYRIEATLSDNPARSLVTVGISNGRRVVEVRETMECGVARRLVVAVGDFHTVVGLSDSLTTNSASDGPPRLDAALTVAMRESEQH